MNTLGDLRVSAATFEQIVEVHTELELRAVDALIGLFDSGDLDIHKYIAIVAKISAWRQTTRKLDANNRKLTKQAQRELEGNNER